MTTAFPPPVQSALRGSQQPFWFLGGRVRLLVSGAATTGTVSVLEFSDTRGQAPPLHVHDREDEIWSVVDGSITFVVGDDVFDLGPGEVALGPRGTAHSYVVRSATARMLVTYAPSGVEEWFVTNSSPLEEDDGTPAPFDVAAIVSAGLRFGVHVVGPPPA